MRPSSSEATERAYTQRFTVRFQLCRDVTLRFTPLSSTAAKATKVYCTAPECETIHDAEGKMVQTFTNGAVITVDKASSEATLEYGGKLVATYHNVTLQMLSLIQATASELK